MAMLLMVTGIAWVFVSVVLLGALDTFTTWFPNDSVAGVSVDCAYAGHPEMRNASKRRVPPKNSFVPHFAGLEREPAK